MHQERTMSRSAVFFWLLGLAACSAADPGVDGLTRGNLAAPTNTPLGDGGKPPGSDGSAGNDSGPLGKDAMAPDSSSATTDAFTGAGAYASSLPPMTAVDIHKGKGVNTTPGKNTACLGCHNGNAPDFLFAGTVFKDKAGTIPAANLEIRVRGNDGNGFITHSDLDGNFWLLKGNALVTPALTGCRDSTNTALMSGNITDTNCNGCHNGNGTDALHLP